MSCCCKSVLIVLDSVTALMQRKGSAFSGQSAQALFDPIHAIHANDLTIRVSSSQPLKRSFDLLATGTLRPFALTEARSRINGRLTQKPINDTRVF